MLRIILTFLIVLSHETQYLAGKNWFEVFSEKLGLNYVFIAIFGIWGQVSVAGFIVITAYFTCEKDSVHYIKIEKLCYQAFTTFIILEALAYIFRPSMFDGIAKSIIKGLLSPLNSTWWYLTGYLILYILIPVLQKFVKYVEKRQFIITVVIIAVVVMIADFVNLRAFGTVSDFIFLYLVTAYIKRYKDGWISRNAKKINAVCAILMIGGTLIIRALGNISTLFLKLQTRIFVNWNILIIGAAISLFYIFKDLNIKTMAGVIRLIASLALGIYILSENNFTGPWLWHDIFRLETVFQQQQFILKYLEAAVIVFLISGLIELIRKIIFNERFCNWLFSGINHMILTMVSKFKI